MTKDILKKNIAVVADIETKFRNARSRTEHISDWIAAFSGSMTFIWLHITFFGGWMLYNSLFTGFDPYPFILLNLFMSGEAIFLSTFVLISQNRMMALGDRRSHIDLQVNLIAEQETTKILQLLIGLCKHSGMDVKQAADMQEMIQKTNIERMVEELEKRINEDDRLVN